MTFRQLFKLTVVAPIALMLCASLPATAATRTVTSLADDGTAGTLRSTIGSALSGDTVNFSVNGTITLTQPTFLGIDKSLNIVGPGAANLVIDGNHAHGVFFVSCCGTAIVSISGVTIRNGLEYSGGGIINYENLTLTDTVITGNSANFGGAIVNFGTLKLINSTVAGNFTSSFGYAGGILNYETLTVTNSTFSGNSSATFEGGAILNCGQSPYCGDHTGSLTVNNSTFSGNSAPVGAAIMNEGGTLAIKNTILANSSSGGNCSSNSTWVSHGHNLSDDGTCTSLFTATGDLNNTAAGLDPGGLANNGGPTQTIALLAGSPAINAIPTVACSDVAGNPVAKDQRAIQRPQGSACDIGAYEAGAMTATPTGTNVSSNLQGGTASPGGVSVTFSNVTTAGTTTLTTTTTGPVPPDGFKLGNPPVTYDISTTAVFSGSITICFNYTGITFNNSPKLFHYQGGSWVNVTTSVNTTTHVVCGSVTSLSPFGIFEEDQPVLPAVNLAVRKVAPILARTGRNLVYGIGVVNLGPDAASGVVLTDPLPADTTFVGAAFGKASCSIVNRTVVSCSIPTQPTPCSFSAGKVTCEIGDLQKFTASQPTGAVALITVRVTAAAGATLTNTAAVTADNPDSNPANNSSTAKTKVTH